MSDDTMTFEIAGDETPKVSPAPAAVTLAAATVVEKAADDDALTVAKSPDVRRVDPAEVAKAADDPPGVAELKRQLETKQREFEAEKRAREAAEKAAKDHATRLTESEAARTKSDKVAWDRGNDAVRAQAEVFQSQLSEIQNAKKATEQEGKMLSAALKEAHEAADYDRVTALTEQIGDVRYKLGLFNDGEVRIKTDAARFKSEVDAYYDNLSKQAEIDKAEAARKAKEAPVQAPANPADEIEAFIKSRPPQAQEWLRAHPETLTDEIAHGEMVLAHKKALRQGIREGSAEYYSHLDQSMGYGQKAADKAPQITPQRRADPVVSAPVSRDVRAANGNLSSSRVTLNAAQIRTAEKLGMTPEEYAVGVKRMNEENAARGSRA